MTSRCSVWPVNFLPVSFMVKIFALCSYWTWRYILTRCPVSAETYRTLRKTFLEAVLLVRPTLVSAPRVFRQCLKLRLSPRFLLFPVLACVCSCCWAACGNRVLCLCVSGSFTIPPVVVVTCAGWEWWSQGTLGDTYTALVYSGAPAYRWLFFFFFPGVPESPLPAFCRTSRVILPCASRVHCLFFLSPSEVASLGGFFFFFWQSGPVIGALALLASVSRLSRLLLPMVCSCSRWIDVVLLRSLRAGA